MQAGQNLRVVITIQADAADQELLVYLPDHRAAGLTLGHGDGHSKAAGRGALNLCTDGRRGKKGQVGARGSFPKGRTR